jgi:hypothetical protein
LRVAVLRGQARLEPWCAVRGVEEALVGGFFVRPDGLPLGEVRTRGVARRHVPFDAPVGRGACVRARAGRRRARSRRATSCRGRPPGDLLQAGPLLVPRRSRRVLAARDDARLQRRQPSSTPTSPTAATRAPALGLARRPLFAVACDGRSPPRRRLTLEELAR